MVAIREERPTSGDEAIAYRPQIPLFALLSQRSTRESNALLTFRIPSAVPLDPVIPASQRSAGNFTLAHGSRKPVYSDGCAYEGPRIVGVLRMKYSSHSRVIAAPILPLSRS